MEEAAGRVHAELSKLARKYPLTWDVDGGSYRFLCEAPEDVAERRAVGAFGRAYAGLLEERGLGDEDYENIHLKVHGALAERLSSEGYERAYHNSVCSCASYYNAVAYEKGELDREERPLVPFEPEDGPLETYADGTYRKYICVVDGRVEYFSSGYTDRGRRVLELWKELPVPERVEGGSVGPDYKCSLCRVAERAFHAERKRCHAAGWLWVLLRMYGCTAEGFQEYAMGRGLAKYMGLLDILGAGAARHARY